MSISNSLGDRKNIRMAKFSNWKSSNYRDSNYRSYLSRDCRWVKGPESCVRISKILKNTSSTSDRFDWMSCI